MARFKEYKMIPIFIQIDKIAYTVFLEGFYLNSKYKPSLRIPFNLSIVVY